MASVTTRERVSIVMRSQPGRTGTVRRRLATDWSAVGLLLALTAVVAWNRATFDMWLARIDVLQQLLPYYGFLGQQLRELNVPGWNPHQLSGMPFAADPLSGWMQFPVMGLFAVLDPVPAFKALLVFNLGFAALTTYAYARVLGLGIAAGLVGAIAFAFGNFVHFNTYCCNIMGNFATWIPLALLGIELALRARGWVSRAAAVSLAGIALSQMLAAWLGQGTYYGLLLVGGYVLYRTTISPPTAGWTTRQRIKDLVATGAAILLGGFALAAAGFLPRLDVNRFMNLSAGDYASVGSASGQGWPLESLVENALNPEFVSRRVYLGTAAVMLALLAPVVARRRHAVPFFALLTIVGLILILDTTSVHRLFYLLPRFQPLHEHAEYRIFGAILIGPAMLAAATVEALSHIRVRFATIALGLLPATMYVLIRTYLDGQGRWLPQHVWIVALVVTLLVVGWLGLRLEGDWRLLQPIRLMRPLASAVPAILILILFLDPAGKDIFESLRGQSSSSTYQTLLRTRAQRDEMSSVYTSCEDAGGVESS